jgi:predicted ATPase with chaperone activity
MMAMNTTSINNSVQGVQSLLDALLSGERFWPTEPQSMEEIGLSEPFLESLTCKLLLVNGTTTGRTAATSLCLPFTLAEHILDRLRSQHLISHRGSGPLNDYICELTKDGRDRALAYQQECAYVGPAPVPLADYVISVEAQAISDEPIRRDELLDAFHDVSLEPGLLNLLGPALNSASGLFLYGAPGNGKSTLAQRITGCFGQEIWLPHAFIQGREIVKVYDPAYHREAGAAGSGERNENAGVYDRRWLRVKRPTVVGGELTMDSLEIRHDPVTNISEAPLQVKSNCGCLLIDDFGRQRISPEELLNHWIVPLENRHDFLKLSSGQKIQVPFEQLIIFSTNLDPADLIDEAFLRRIPYRIEVTDPSDDEFHSLFQLVADRFGCEYDPDAVEYLLETYYRPQNRPRRRCHARDLLQQVRNYCTYNEVAFEMRPEYFDKVAHSFFTIVRIKDQRRHQPPTEPSSAAAAERDTE